MPNSRYNIHNFFHTLSLSLSLPLFVDYVHTMDKSVSPFRRLVDNINASVYSSLVILRQTVVRVVVAIIIIIMIG